MERCKDVDGNEVFVDNLGDEGGEPDEEEGKGAEKGAEEQAMGDQNIKPASRIFQKFCAENGRKR